MSELHIPDEAREAAVRLLAENQHRRYDSAFDASHLSWRDFADSAAEDVDALLATGWGPAVATDKQTVERTVSALKPKAVREEAWRIHRAEGHPEGYEGPCWGPTAANVEQARKNLAPSGDGDTDV